MSTVVAAPVNPIMTYPPFAAKIAFSSVGGLILSNDDSIATVVVAEINCSLETPERSRLIVTTPDTFGDDFR